MARNPLIALEKANEVRDARAKLKREIKDGDLSVAELLAEVSLPAWLDQMPIEALLQAVPGLGDRMIRRILDQVPIKYGAYVGDLTYRKRRVLADALAKREAAKSEGAEKRARPREQGGANGRAGRHLRAKRVA